ncbi:MAG: hypothetical protein AAF611_16840 [Bacteroidota bacterium]
MHPIRLIYIPVGFLYLWIRYRNGEKVAEAKKEKYENSYSTAGATLVVSTVGVVFFIVLSIILIGAIYVIFKHGPSAP